MSLATGLICVLKNDCGIAHAIVTMDATHSPTSRGVRFQLFVYGLAAGKKGFHVHQCGNLIDGCKTLGKHYNPQKVTHGGLNNHPAHRGDLGNITIASNGECEQVIVSQLLTLTELPGRSLVIHAHKDDLGLGKDQESLETGNSGARLCCGVIGYR